MQCERNKNHRVHKKTGKVALDGGVNYERFICRDCDWRSAMITNKGSVKLPKVDKE